MEIRIADTFTDSLVRLTGNEQKAVKTTAFDLQLNPANPGASFHRIDKAKDKNFWSMRVSRDIRLIVHKSSSSLLLCYVDHHGKAYDWAERRKLETHPKTGCPSYKFRPVQKSGPFRVVPDSVCDPHTILLHGVLSNFRSRAMRQLEIIAPRHQLDVLRRNQRSQSLERPKHQDFCARRNL